MPDDPPPPHDSLAESVDLVRRAQQGEQPALNRLFERYYERVRRIVRLRLGKNLRGFMDSGDILQATFIGAVQAFDRFEMRDETSLIHWLGKIAEHKIRDAADYHGAQKRDRQREVALRKVLDAQKSGELTLEPADDGKSPLQAISDGEDIAAIETCLAELKDEWREVILLRDYEGSSWATAAEILGSPSPDAARLLYARAIAELSRRVGGTRGS